MQKTTHPNHEDVLAALRNLRYPAGLRNSPLLELPSVRAKLPVPADAKPDDSAIALADFLAQAIDKLRPPGEENLRQREWLRYYVLHHLFRRGDSNQSVQQVLGISRSYLYEIRNEAVDALATLLLAAPKARISLSEPIPLSADFVGRQAELAGYRRLLASQRLATVYGFAGTGKTALAAQLASECQAAGQPVIWITLSPGVNVHLDGFLDALAIGLEELGHGELRNLLLSHARGAPSYPADTRINYAVNSLVANQITLCLDDIHLAGDVPEVERFLSSLVPRQQAARTPLIVTSRTEPAIAQGRHVAPLQGLNDQDGRLLLEQTGVNWLPDELYVDLQQRVGGNAAFLKFFTAWAQNLNLEHLPAAEREGRARTFIGQIGESLASYRFLLDSVLRALQEAERSILERIALSRKSVNIEDSAIYHLFADLDSRGVGAWLSRLEGIQVLMRSGDTDTYRVHDLVRTYLVAQLAQAPERRRHLHGLLANYYEVVGDYIETAFHLIQSGEFEATARLLIQHTEGFIKKGQASAIVNIAHEIPLLDLPVDLRFRWYEVLARATWMAGQHERVSTLYAEALEWPDLTPELQAMLHWRLGNTREVQGMYAEAKMYYLVGLDLLPEQAMYGREWIRLTMALAVAEVDMGNLISAQALGVQAIKAMEASSDLALDRGSIYGAYGNICHVSSNYSDAQYYLERSVGIFSEANDLPILALAYHSLARVLNSKGEMQRALEVIGQAEEIFNALADSFGLAMCYTTHGNVLTKLGLAESGLPILLKALSLSQSIQSRALEAGVLLNLGKAHLALSEMPIATEYLQRASELSEELGQIDVLTEALSLLVEPVPSQSFAIDTNQTPS